MSRLMKERLKTICIFIFSILGLLQVGILWGYQNQGTPTSFIMRIFNGSAQISSTDARERLFIPDRLILSSGGKSRYILDEDNNFYDGLWDEAKQGLSSIASGTASLKATNEEWGKVAEKKGFIIDFGYTMTPELLKWFLGTGLEKQELPVIFKIMVKPDIIDKNMSTFYICSTDNKVYISDLIRNERTKSLDDILTAVSENEGQEYRDYYTFRGSKIDGLMGAEPDVLYVSASPSYWPYFEYSSKPPARAEKREDLAVIVLGAEKDRYGMSEANDTIQFTYGNNIYSYYTDGYLTYRYLGNADSSGKGEIGKALLNAYKFVARINEISEPTADIVLTSVQEKQAGVFGFSFDYRLKGMPVKVKVDMKYGNVQSLEHAINIQADSRRVLKCEWFLRDFIQNAKVGYNDRFTDVLGPTGMDYLDMKIQDMRSGYFINSSSDIVLKPMLLIKMKDESDLQIDMLPEKGD